MKKRSLLTAFLALVISLVTVFAFAGCDDKKDSRAADNSFVGCLSETTYDNENSAARGFLSEELDGAATKTQFVDAEAGATLSAEEIENLELGDDVNAADVESAVYYTVKYIETDATRAAADSSYNTKSYEIIIIKIGSHYYYYIPIMPKGGSITNSYIEMVCDPQKYFNVTETAVTKSTSKVAGMSVTATITTTTKVANGNLHLKMVSSMLGEESVEEYYFVTVNNSIVGYAYNEYSGSWYRAGSLSYTSLEEYLEAELFKFDHSYFERTESGFKMKGDKTQQYLNDVMGDQFKSILGMGLSINSVGANYYVKDGRLDEVNVDLSMKGTLEGMSVQATASGHITYTNYGTTVINLPFAV